MIPKLLLNEKSFTITPNDLPLFIHGEVQSGASYFSIITFASLVLQGESILFYSAFFRGLEALQQLLSQEKIAVVRENEESVVIKKRKILAVQSGDEPLLMQMLTSCKNTQRIICIKNIETLTKNITPFISHHKFFIISGDIERYRYKQALLNEPFTTKILFSHLPTLLVQLPALDRFQAIFLGATTSGVTQATNQKQH